MHDCDISDLTHLDPIPLLLQPLFDGCIPHSNFVVLWQFLKVQSTESSLHVPLNVACTRRIYLDSVMEVNQVFLAVTFIRNVNLADFVRISVCNLFLHFLNILSFKNREEQRSLADEQRTVSSTGRPHEPWTRFNQAPMAKPVWSLVNFQF